MLTHYPSVPRAVAIPAAERRAHAVRTLLELASHTAPDQISTAAIAARMGVSHGALFRHFPSREALWAEAVSWAVAELEHRFAQAAAARGPESGSAMRPMASASLVAERLSQPLAEATSLLAIHAGFLQQHPGLVRMLFAELQRPGTSPARETGKAFMHRLRLRLAALIAAAQREGALAPEHDPHDLAALLVATQQGLMLQALVHDGFAELGERSRRSMALFLRAGPGTAPRPGVCPAAAPAE